MFIVLGCGLYAWDVGTDAGFTSEMRGKLTCNIRLINMILAARLGETQKSNSSEFENCTMDFQFKLEESVRSCENQLDKSNFAECLDKLQNAAISLKNCFNKEHKRFSGETWSLMFYVSLGELTAN